MNTQTLEKMNQMKLYGMHRALNTSLESEQTNNYTIDQFIAYLVDAESDDRHVRKIQRLTKNARFRYTAAMEKIHYEPGRKLDKNMILRLAECKFIRKGENLLITGSTGVGKSYLASALGYHACEQEFKVLYFNTARLLARLKMAKADDSYIKEMTRIERHHLVILDDFGMQPIDNQSRLMLLDMIEDRHGKTSMIITSQLPVNKWHEVIGEKTVADAIMDRVLHNAHRIDLKGESLRRNQTNQNEEN